MNYVKTMFWSNAEKPMHETVKNETDTQINP